jgi:hypothetical protein
MERNARERESFSLPPSAFDFELSFQTLKTQTSQTKKFASSSVSFVVYKFNVS